VFESHIATMAADMNATHFTAAGAPLLDAEELSNAVHRLQELGLNMKEKVDKREDEHAKMRDDLDELLVYMKAIGKALKIRFPSGPPPSARHDDDDDDDDDDAVRASITEGIKRRNRSARSRSPARSESSLADSDATGLGGTSTWDGKSSRLPKKVKVESLPRLGSKEKEGLPYHKWKVDARATIAAAYGAEWVLDIDPPTEEEPAELREWYEPVDKMVYAALLKAVSDVPILSDFVRRLQGTWGAGYKAWRTIKKHYVRMADTNRTYLASKLTSMKPKERESMESLLNRFELLREEYDQYGVPLSDELLITQVFSHLSQNWRVNTGLNGKDLSKMTWGEVKEKLQQEDNIRRQSNTTAEDATLPLGWTKGYAAAKVASAGESDAKDKPAVGLANKAGGSPPSKGKEKPKQGGAPKEVKKQGEGLLFVCYCCKKSGHVWTKCRNKPDGWVPSDEDKAEADRLRAQRIAQSNAARAKSAGDQASASAASGSTSAPKPASSSGEKPPQSSASEGLVTLPQV
jgi:gag-polypeptide of LTR copia-type